VTETIGIGIAVAGLVITLVSGLIGLAYKSGVLSRRTDENSEDIKEIKGTYVVGLKDLDAKLDKVLESVNLICERVSNLEGKINK
jgi:hypothetical protein